MKKEIRNAITQELLAVSNYVGGGPGKGKGKGKGKKGKGRSGPYKGGKKNDKNAGTLLQCAICDRFGHDSAHCWDKMSKDGQKGAGKKIERR